MPADPVVLHLPVADRGAPVAVALESVRTGRDLDVLSPEERVRVATMAPPRAAEFTRGRSLLRRLAAAVLGVPARRVPLRVEPGGRLSVVGRSCGVSLSHSRTTTAAALWTDGCVGIDVEEPPAVLHPGLLRRCCHSWAPAVAALPARRRAAAFARVWTAQEACGKSLGLGLSGGPWRIPVDPFASTGRWGEVRWFRVEALSPVAVTVAIREPMHSKESP